MITDKLKLLAEADSALEGPFADFEEEIIVSIALDLPEYFLSLAHLLEWSLFTRPHTQYVMMTLLDYVNKYQAVPTRQNLANRISKALTVDSANWEDIVRVITRPASERDYPAVKDTLNNWAKRKSFGLLYSPAAQDAYARGDYQALEDIVDAANRISDVSSKGFWFYEQIEELFIPDNSIHLPTGFNRLDKLLNNGGPSPGEVICWMAPTSVGKTLMLCNNAINQTKFGVDTLFITFELDTFKTAARCCGALTDVALKNFSEHRELILERCRRTYQTNNAKLAIWDLPPDECSVNDIYALLHSLRRTKGWSPRCIIIDYLELMVGRRDSDNHNDYTRQKHVSNQLRGLAKNAQAIVYTATQTNRSGNNTDELIDLTKIAESYGKTMSLDYIISLNQSDEDHRAGTLDMFLAKNRNGPKHDVIKCLINYSTMGLKEKPF